MSQHRTAQGRMVDMSALAARNEKTRAVGNMKVNARGDTIDGLGKVIAPVTEKVNKGYNNTVSNKSAQVQPDAKPVITEELTPDEIALEENLEDDLEIEKIKAKEMNKK